MMLDTELEIKERVSLAYLLELVDSEDTPGILAVGTSLLAVACAVSCVPVPT